MEGALQLASPKQSSAGFDRGKQRQAHLLLPRQEMMMLQLFRLFSRDKQPGKDGPISFSEYSAVFQELFEA
jgi:hypothetical protein